MTNKLFQTAINQMSSVFPGREIGVVDYDGNVIACSEPERLRNGNDDVFALDFGSTPDIFIHEGYTYKPFGDTVRPEFAVFVSESDDVAASYVGILAVSFSLLRQYYDEKFDRTNFIKKVIQDNVLPGEINTKARELRLNIDVPRAVFLINVTTTTEITAFDVVQNLFPEKNRDFVFNINEGDVVLVKEIKPNTEARDLDKLALSISDTLSGEYFTKISIGIGSPVTGIKELSVSFKEAQQALEVGKVFDVNKSIVNHSKLGVARLIYNVPENLCRAFMDEIFCRGSVDQLDGETLFTIQKFFENNLNVSETSRKLFVHRNTLVYRLDKIKKLTGLDLREFEDAIVFKIALMVRRYLTSRPRRI